MRSRVLGVAAGLLAMAACGGSSYGTGAGPGGSMPGGGGRSMTITVGNNFFSPTPDTVPPGSVTFTWATPSNGHNVTWDSGPGTLPQNSPTMSSGTWPATLQAGVYEYHCTIHGAPGSGMHGTIVVQ